MYLNVFIDDKTSYMEPNTYKIIQNIRNNSDIKLNIGICEDDTIEKDILIDMLGIVCPDAHITVYSNGAELLDIFRPSLFDLLILDIYMPEKTGIETLTEIRKIDSDIPVAFTTTSKEFALEGFQLHAIRYLIKPYDISELKELIDTVKKGILKEPVLSIINRGRTYDFPINKIEYIEQIQHNLIIHTKDNEPVTITGKTNDVNEILSSISDTTFLRCHKSFIVNLKYVVSIDTNMRTFLIDNGDMVYISRPDFLSVKLAFENYLFESVRSN